MWEATFDVFNLLDSQDADIDYYYVSRLPGEPASGVADRHTRTRRNRGSCAAVSRCTSDFLQA